MRVLLTCNFSPWSPYSGGGQRSTHNLASALVRRGHRVSVLFTKAPFEHVDVPNDVPYEVEWARFVWPRSKRAIPLRTLVTFSIARRIVQLGRREREPFIVHSQGEEAASLPTLRERGRVFGLPPFGLVVTPRFPDLPTELSDRSTWRTVRLARLWLFHEKYMSLGIALRGADFVSPPSFYGGDLVREAYRLRGETVRPVHNGVPAEFLDYTWQPGSPDRPLVFFGRLDYDKGIDTLLDALGQLGERAPKSIHLYGRGPQEEAMRRRAAERGLGERVQFLGWADHHQLGRALQDASLAVIPSRAENFSLAVLSVLAVGTPIVTTPVGGTPEVIDDGVHGRLVPASDSVALAEAIASSYADLDRAASMAARGRERVRSGFTWDAAAARFEGIYDEALAGRPIDAAAAR